MTEVLKSRVGESNPQWYSWNVTNLVSSLCRIICDCTLKIPGNTLVWNSCGGAESSDVRPKKVKQKVKRLIFTACRNMNRKRGQNIFCLYRFWSCFWDLQPLVLYLGCWKGISLCLLRLSKQVNDKRFGRPQDLVLINLMQHHVLEHIQVGHETVTRDPHVALLLLMVCDHYTLPYLSTPYFHVQRILFKVDFLQHKEGANYKVWSFFSSFRETNWFQQLTYLLPLPTARYSKGGHAGSELPGAACSAFCCSAVLPLPCTVIAQPFSFTACTSPVWFMFPSILAV